MDHSENRAIDWRFLTTLVKIHPGRFESDIIGPTGEKRGKWTAHICIDAHDLCMHLDLSFDEIAKIETICPKVWPLAYLNSITISEDHRDSNFGSIGLTDFLATAVKHDCQISIVRIGWDESSPMEKNLHFYLKNGWTELFEKDSKGIPTTLPLSFHNLSSVSPAAHFTPTTSPNQPSPP